MAKEQSHFSFSVGLAVLYALGGMFILDLRPEVILLSSVIVVIAGMLPNIDEVESGSAQEFGGLLAAASPLVLFEFYPAFSHGGITRVVLVVICCYLISRVVIVRLLQTVTSHRGIIHSIPAAILSFEAVYLLFWDLGLRARMFVAFAAFLGFFVHLLMDAYTNVDLVGRALGRGVEKRPGALKLKGNSWGSTIAMYTCVMVLGWFVLKDIYPGFRLTAGVHY
ncbi:MAG: metal-dependent hydrolase [Bdellovibrionota bacterium]